MYKKKTDNMKKKISAKNPKVKEFFFILLSSYIFCYYCSAVVKDKSNIYQKRRRRVKKSFFIIQLCVWHWKYSRNIIYDSLLELWTTFGNAKLLIITRKRRIWVCYVKINIGLRRFMLKSSWMCKQKNWWLPGHTKKEKQLITRICTTTGIVLPKLMVLH